MQNYAPGGAIQVTINLLNEAGADLTPVALRWRVLDEAETVLQDWTVASLPAPTEKSVTVTVLGALNILTPPATRGLRTVELEVTTAAGMVVLTESVLLQATSALMVGYNSFCTYAQALMTVQDYSDRTVTGWESATRDQRERALIEAFNSIRRMPLIVGVEENLYSAGRGLVRDYGWLSLLEPDEYLSNVSARQQKALRAAQLLEASEVMNADPVLIARRNGLMSMTVGESSQFFRTGKPMEAPMLSSQAIEILKPWLRYSTTIGRG